MTIQWTDNALNDLESIKAYIGKDSKYYSIQVVRSIISKVKTLEDFPKMGRIVPEMNDRSIREVFSHNYRIIYKFENDTIKILTVIHGASKL
jgi:toxin ParE1/3/4